MEASGTRSDSSPHSAGCKCWSRVSGPWESDSHIRAWTWSGISIKRNAIGLVEIQQAALAIDGKRLANDSCGPRLTSDLAHPRVEDGAPAEAAA